MQLAFVFLGLAVLCLPIPIMSYAGDVRIVDWPREVSGFPAFRDFANLWTGGHAALSGAYEDLFIKVRHTAEIERLLGVTHPALAWSYPPTAMIALTPFALLPYPAAVLAWAILEVALFLAALGVRNAQGETLATVAAVALVPGVFLCVTYGQTALLTAAILYFGLRWARETPWLSASVLALLVCKPQLGLMLPAALIGLGAWRAIAATGVMSFVYLAATVAILGLEPWRLFFEITLPQQAGLFSQERIDSTMLFAPFFVLRELGMDPNFAMWMQVVLSIALMVGVIAGLRRLQDFDAQFVLVAMAAMLASPYMQSYELPLVALAAGRIVLHRNGASEVGSASLAVILGVVTIGALLSLSVFIRSGVNYMSPLLLVTFLAVLGQSLMQRPLDLQSTPVSARAA
jgi:hypothetical protein